MGGDTHTFASTGTFRKCPNIFNPQRNTYYSTVLHTALHTHTYFMKSSFFNLQKVRRLIIIFIYLSSIIIISPVEMKVCVSTPAVAIINPDIAYHRGEGRLILTVYLCHYLLLSYNQPQARPHLSSMMEPLP